MENAVQSKISRIKKANKTNHVHLLTALRNIVKNMMYIEVHLCLFHLLSLFDLDDRNDLHHHTATADPGGSSSRQCSR